MTIAPDGLMENRLLGTAKDSDAMNVSLYSTRLSVAMETSNVASGTDWLKTRG